MKAFRMLAALFVGIAMSGSGLSTMSVKADNHMKCPSCGAGIPSATKPVVAMLDKDMKCSMCGMDMKAQTAATKMNCPACKADMTMCAMCAKAHGEAQAKSAISGAATKMPMP